MSSRVEEMAHFFSSGTGSWAHANSASYGRRLLTHPKTWRVRDTPIPPEVILLGRHQDDVADEMTPIVGVLHVRALPPSPVPAPDSGPRLDTIIPPAAPLPRLDGDTSPELRVSTWGRLKKWLSEHW